MRQALVVLAIAAAPVWAVPAAALEPMPAHPSRIIVKFGSALDVCAHCLLAEGVPFQSVTGAGSLDELNARHGVREIRALGFEHHGLAGGRRAAHAARLDAIRARFKTRSRRFDGLAPGRYRVRLGRPTRKTHKAAAIQVLVFADDVKDADLALVVK